MHGTTMKNIDVSPLCLAVCEKFMEENGPVLRKNSDTNKT
jgi:hypothetical protein